MKKETINEPQVNVLELRKLLFHHLHLLAEGKIDIKTLKEMSNATDKILLSARDQRMYNKLITEMPEIKPIDFYEYENIKEITA
jgi:hypothetical protein